jgi:hypothetical protein
LSIGRVKSRLISGLHKGILGRWDVLGCFRIDHSPATPTCRGKGSHPIRDPGGHSYGVQPVLVSASLDSEEFAWGQDLFNHGYYWEAHEAWEGIWQIANRGSPLRALLKGLILLCATGVKIREGKRTPAMRHARRAGALTIFQAPWAYPLDHLLISPKRQLRQGRHRA